MKILFDHGTPAPLRQHLVGHSVDTAASMGWERLQNGELLDQAQRHGYEVLVTTDQSMRYQQNLSRRGLAIVVLMRASWPLIQQCIDEILGLIDEIRPSEIREVAVGEIRWRDNGHN